MKVKETRKMLTNTCKYIMSYLRFISTGKKYKYYTCLLDDRVNFYVSSDPYKTKAEAMERAKQIEKECVTISSVEIAQIRTNTRLA